MSEFGLIGKRLAVRSSDKTVDLGLGTYLWNSEILLDTGKKISGKNCQWRIVEPSPVPPFGVPLEEDTRVFQRNDRGSLLNKGDWLKKGERVTIDVIEVCPWNHGGYVAGKINWYGDEYWLVMSELILPEEKPPFLRVVA